MAFWFLLVALAVSADSLSYNTSARVTGDAHVNDERQLGYFVKSPNRDGDYERVRQNAVVVQPAKINSGGSVKDGSSERTIYVVVGPKVIAVNTIDEENSKNGRPKNDSDKAVPLHVANSARQKCMEGYEADENGTCQKALPPKGEKSFKLRRRRRAEQKR